MNARRDAAEARLREARGRLARTLRVARIRLDPRMLAADSAEIVAARAGRFALRAAGAARWRRLLGGATMLGALGTSVLLRLAVKQERDSPVGGQGLMERE